VGISVVAAAGTAGARPAVLGHEASFDAAEGTVPELFIGLAGAGLAVVDSLRIKCFVKEVWMFVAVHWAVGEHKKRKKQKKNLFGKKRLLM